MLISSLSVTMSFHSFYNLPISSCSTLLTSHFMASLMSWIADPFLMEGLLSKRFLAITNSSTKGTMLSLY